MINLMIKTDTVNKVKMSILFLSMIMLSKALPHKASFAPFLALLSIFSGHFFRSKIYSVYNFIILFVISDIMLFTIKTNVIFGDWTFYTYPSLLMVTLINHKLLYTIKNNNYLFISVSPIITSLSYWIFTNFGVWLTSNIYIHDMSGLTLCYIAAIPFLITMVYSNIIIITGYIIINYTYKKYKSDLKNQTRNKLPINYFKK